MPSPAPPLIFDRALHRQRLQRAAPGFGAASFLKARAAQDIAARLSPIMQRFPLAVDLGARDGAFARALEDEPEAAGKIDTLLELDLSQAMLASRAGLRVVADEERLPLAPGRFDLAVSSLSLHWTNDFVGALAQARRALRPGGLFIGALLGNATLTELRQALLSAEAELGGGAAMRVSPFLDAPDGAGLLQRAGFAQPVTDVDKIKVRYSHPLKLLEDLRAMGETSVLVERPRKPMSRALLTKAMETYQAMFAEPDGRVVASFEIVTLTGWAPEGR